MAKTYNKFVSSWVHGILQAKDAGVGASYHQIKASCKMTCQLCVLKLRESSSNIALFTPINRMELYGEQVFKYGKTRSIVAIYIGHKSRMTNMFRSHFMNPIHQKTVNISTCRYLMIFLHQQVNSRIVFVFPVVLCCFAHLIQLSWSRHGRIASLVVFFSRLRMARRGVCCFF